MATALFEGNFTPNITIDSVHGNNAFNTMYRNWAFGRNSSGYTAAPLPAIAVNGQNHAQYSIGNVLWQPGQNVQHLILEPSMGINPVFMGPKAAYILGAGSFDLGTGRETGADQWDDGYAYSQFHRHLDFDYFTNSQHTNPSNPVTNLPNSLYLERKPWFFGTFDWPPVNPAGATHAERVGILPAKARYDAGTPFALAPGAGLPPDTEDPTVSIQSPGNGETVTANVTIRATAVDTSGNSATASVTVNVNNPVIPPTITTQPADQTLSVGGTTSFAVEVAGTPPFSYQWQKNGVNIPGASATSYTISAVALNDNGNNYRVRVSNSAGSVFSNNVLLTVNEGPRPFSSYNFDEGSGTTLLDRSGANNGNVIGASWSNGKNSGGLAFDGTDDSVSLGNWNISGSEMTISTWVYSTNWNANADVRIISKAEGVQEQQHTWMLSDKNSNLRFRLKTNGTTTTLIGDGTLPTNTWVHVAAVYNGSTIKLYQDGEEVGSAAKTGSIDHNTQQITLGMNPDNTNHLQGKLDDLRIYNVALSQAEIQASMNSSVGPPSGGGAATPTPTNTPTPRGTVSGDRVPPEPPPGLRIEAS